MSSLEELMDQLSAMLYQSRILAEGFREGASAAFTVMGHEDWGIELTEWFEEFKREQVEF